VSVALCRSLRDTWTWSDPHRVSDWSREQFKNAVNPFNYHEPDEQERFHSAARLLDSVRCGERFASVLEIACAEGHFTDILSDRCASLLAVDISDLALERAQQRCAGEPVEFRTWDLVHDPMPGTFDVVVVMDVLEMIRGRRTIRMLRPKLVDAVQPGGYLLVGNSRQCKDLEQALWAKWLIRGGKHINEYIGAHPDLLHVRSESSDLFINSLLRKKPMHGQLK
jgi:2-polyprenyl-3-methyl-5-hydroxy-6-metoxy-1,4-benzoquinol methylase